jgi:phage shock protein C
MNNKLYRSTNDRMLMGVAGGLASYLNIDPVLVRLFFVLLTLSTGYGAIIYFVLAFLLPVDQREGKANGFEEVVIVMKVVS